MEDFERPYKQVSRFKALTLFVFRPCAFLDLATKHDIAWQLSVSSDLRESYLRGEYKPDAVRFRSTTKDRTEGLRRSLQWSGMVVAGAAVSAVLAGYLVRGQFGPLGSLGSSLLQAIGAGIILWATLWQLTRDLQSFGGKSLPERVHSWLFSCLYTLGTFLFFVVYSWQA